MKLRSYLNVALLATVLLTLGSCRSQKMNMAYFTDLQDVEQQIPTSFELRIVPDDQLLISVTAPDQEAAAPYNNIYQPVAVTDFNETRSSFYQTGLTRRNQNLTYQPYVVSVDGFINFPRLGKIHVEGMTLAQLGDYLTEKISDKVTDPMVTVELLNFQVNVIGEVRAPGTYHVSRDRFSVLDAISTAGDLNTFGVRNNILLIREENGQRTYHRLNLNSKDIFDSPYFYLKQNDVIYVEPNKIREANARTDQERQFKLSMTSVVVSAASVIASLAIALFIK